MEPRRRNPDALLRRYARKMRREPSDGEKATWELLRDRRLGGFEFRRQVPIDNYIADFYCEAASLVIEVDGEQHATPESLDYDRRRDEAFGRLLIRTLRFPSLEVVKDPVAVARTILRVLTTGS